MNSTWIKTMAGAVLGLSVLAGVMAAENAPERTIEGVWLTVVQLRDCQSGVPLAPAGRGLVTFAKDGTLSETTAPASGAPPSFRSPGHGIWKRLNWRKYSATFVVQRLNADGTFAGWSKLEASFELSESGDQYTSTATFEILGPTGNVLLTGCATSTATRLE